MLLRAFVFLLLSCGFLGAEGRAQPKDLPSTLPEPFARVLSESKREPNIKDGLPAGFQFQVDFPPDGTPAWNHESYWSMLGLYEVVFHLMTWGPGGEVSEYRGESSRIYPRKIDGFTKPQLFRERVSLYQGGQEDAIRYLTIRPLGDQSDNLWSYSPVLQRTRRMNDVNREDRLVGTSISLDDLNFFSRKIESLRLIEEKEARYLLPFATKLTLSADADKEKDCFLVLPAPLREAAQLVFGEAASSQERLGKWLGSEIFVDREVTVNVFEARNPYRELAHEIHIVDKEFSIPVYRLSYDVLGRLRYSAYQVIGVAKSGERSFPAVEYSLFYDHEADRLSLLTYHEQKWCSAKMASLQGFQPKSLLPHSTSEKKGASSPETQ